MKFKVILWNSILISYSIHYAKTFSTYTCMHVHTYVQAQTSMPILNIPGRYVLSKNHFPSPSFTFIVQYTPIWCLSNEHPKLLPKVTFKQLAAKFSHESSTFVSSAADSADLRPSSKLFFLICITHFDGFFVTFFLISEHHFPILSLDLPNNEISR